MTLPFLNPQEALIFRITHRDNLAWILDHGLHARSSQMLDPNFRRIGDFDLIDKRSKRQVSVGPGGTLNDYVPFYFTPLSMMAYNIRTGYRGIEQIPNEDIVILCASLKEIAAAGISYVFTDQHAYRATARYFKDLGSLDEIPWSILQNRDFKHDPDDPGKTDRYQAEALIWKHLPIEALQGICSCSADLHKQVQAELEQRGLTLKAMMRRDWYF